MTSKNSSKPSPGGSQPEGEGGLHWADRTAADVSASGARHAVVCTGISPSGPFHVGHLREIVTGDAIHEALGDRGVSSRLTFVVDNLDPLRKVYPFLDEETYAPLVGRSLSEVPAPGGAEGTYDDHFAKPFLEALAKLKIVPEVVPASELYGSGRMDGVVFEALEGTEAIASILREVTGKDVPPSWSPWTPRCRACRRITKGEVLGFDAGAGTIRSRCGACGETSEQGPAEGGKLSWRIDWPARWKVLGVTVEPFGKDHATRGGSYDTGIRIAREVFGAEPPRGVVYEWIALRGQGDMAASRGNVLAVHEMLEAAPPEVLRYMVIKSRPTRSISFDPGLPLLRLVDEVDDTGARGRDERALELSRGEGFRAVGVPFKHIVVVAQIAGFDLDKTLEILDRGGYAGLDRDLVRDRMSLARTWLERYAPDDQKISVPEALPDAARELEPDQKGFLGRLAGALEGGETDPAVIHDTIYRLATEEPEGPGAKRGFEAIYRALIGRDRGPRAGFFVAILGSDRAAARFSEAARS